MEHKNHWFSRTRLALASMSLTLTAAAMAGAQGAAPHAGHAPGAARGERSFSPGVVVGYTRPVGYPRKFASTALPELGVQAGSEQGTGPMAMVGVGLRKQVNVRSVVDVGPQSDVFGGDGAPQDRIRVIVGYSAGF